MQFEMVERLKASEREVNKSSTDINSGLCKSNDIVFASKSYHSVAHSTA